MQRNKVHAVTTLARVALDLGERLELLDELIDQMDTEDGVIWVYGTEEDPICALSADGVECLQDLIVEHRRQQA